MRFYKLSERASLLSVLIDMNTIDLKNDRLKMAKGTSTKSSSAKKGLESEHANARLSHIEIWIYNIYIYNSNTSKGNNE